MLACAEAAEEDGAPGTARLEILTEHEGAWRMETVTDANSTSFEDAIVFTPAGGVPGIVTLGGNRPMVRLWHREADAWTGEMLWIEELGAEPTHMRHAVLADLWGNGEGIAMAAAERGLIGHLTHGDEGWDVRRVDATDASVDALAAGDVDGDGRTELYAATVIGDDTTIRRHAPRDEVPPATVASLGSVHARALAVLDADGTTGTELYALVVIRGQPAEVRRLDADASGTVATLTASDARAMAVGDVDGDQHPDLLISADDGVWWVSTATRPWAIERVEAAAGPRTPTGPAVALLDVDADGRSEAYVALDGTGELVRITWSDAGEPERTVLATRPAPAAVTTRAITWFPTSMLE